MSNIVNLPPNTKSGEYKGFLHTEGGIQVIVDGTQQVEVEKNEYSICRAAMEDERIHKFENKTHKQILQKLFVEDGCVFEQGKEESGNFIVCRLVVLDDKPRTISGTVKDILNTMQNEKACRMTNDYSKRKLGGIFKKVDSISEKIKDRIELVLEMIKEYPKKAKLKDRVELLNEMLEEEKSEFIKPKEGCGCSVEFEEGGNIELDNNYYISVYDKFKDENPDFKLTPVGEVFPVFMFKHIISRNVGIKGVLVKKGTFSIASKIALIAKDEKSKEAIKDYKVQWVGGVEYVFLDVNETFSEGGDVKSKKVIRRNLPINKEYKLIDSFYTGGIIDNPMTCENCGRPIANVAVIKDEDGKVFDVGMDCAETLSSIKNSMEFMAVGNDFKEATAIRNKIRKLIKEGGVITVENTPIGTVRFLGKKYDRMQFNFTVEKPFCFKYLPDFKKDIINPEKNDFMPRYFIDYNFNFNFDYFKDKVVEPKEFFVDEYKVLVRRFEMPNYAEDGTIRNYNNTIEIKVLKGDETAGVTYTYMHKDIPSRIIYAINEYEFNKFGDNKIKLEGGGDIKSKKSEQQFLEGRSFNEFHPLLSSSGMNYSEPLTSYKPESDTNIQRKSNSASNSEEKMQNGGKFEPEKTKKTEEKQFRYFGTDLTGLMFAGKSNGFNISSLQEKMPDTKIVLVIKNPVQIDLSKKVKISDFSGAIIPKGLSVAENILRKNNILEIRYYNKGEGVNSNQLKDGGSVLLAPNGQSSNLSHKQYYLVRTPEFINFFGDWINSPETASKVVDENGEPLVCWHGSHVNFNEFKSRDGAIFFAVKKELAQLYGKAIPVFINAKKIDTVNQTKNKWWKDKYSLVESAIESMTIKNMYDAILLKEVADPPYYEPDREQIYSDIYVVNKSEQIKLADGTNADFDPTNPDIRYADGGMVDNEVYKKWKLLVNMSKGELEDFYNSQEGKEAGLTPSEAKEKGIDSGRESARWIMKMKDTTVSEWTPSMWRWANKQISFISRMSGMKGGLYDDKGRKTRKHTSLLIWGHNPEKNKFDDGGDIPEGDLENSEKGSKFTQNIIKNEIQNILRGKGSVRDGDAIQATLLYLRRNESASTESVGAKSKSDLEEEKLTDKSALMFDNGGWIEPNRDFESSEKKSKYIKKIINKNTHHDISRESKKSNGTVIETIASYLRGSEGAGSQIRNSKLYRKKEKEFLKTYVTDNNLWVSVTEFKNKIGEGAEQKVYLLADGKSVVKINSCIFYNSWEDYLHNLLLHNYFFPDTAYELVGFMEDRYNKLFAVVKQPFIKETESTDLQSVKQFLSENGFVNIRYNDYCNPKLGIILEDLHDQNVLTKNDTLYFIDTVFYISPDKKFKDGGEIAPQINISKFLSEHENLSGLVAMVDINTLDKYKEFDRKKEPLRGQAYYNQLKKQIIKNGITTPLALSYGAEDSKLSIGEGNHRLAIAKELGYTELPAYVHVYRTNNRGTVVKTNTPFDYKNTFRLSPMDLVIDGVTPYLKIVTYGDYFKTLKTKEYSKGGLLAPNGNNTNLTPEQYKLVRTPEFINFFGDWINSPETSSKVIDENGEPLVVYYRSKKTFNIFDTDKQLNGWLGKGFYFSESKFEFKDYGNKLLSVFLNIRNPFIVKGESPADFLYELKKMFNTDKFETTETLKENSYDGVIYKHWDYEGKMFSCFEPNQIKIADGTNTTFDPNNTDIRFKEGGEMWVHSSDEDMTAYTLSVKKSIEDAGYYVSNPNYSKTDFGNSNYLSVALTDSIEDYPYRAKVRISDHGVTNRDRMANEIHLHYPQSKPILGINYAIKEIDFKLNRNKYFKQVEEIESYPVDMEVNEANLRPTDEILSERLSTGRRGAGRKVFHVRRVNKRPVTNFIYTRYENKKLEDGGEILGIGSNTNVGKIQEEHGSQFKINGQWYHKSIVKPSNIAPEIKKRDGFYNGIIIPETINPNYIISAFENEMDWNKVEKYTEKMKLAGLDNDFPAITGFPSIIDEDDIGKEFLNGNKVTQSDIGRLVWNVTDGHHRSIAAINANLPYIKTKVDYSTITEQENLYKKGGHIYQSVGIEGNLVGKSRNPYIGKETEINCFDKNIRCFVSDYSYRFIYVINGKNVSVLQFDKEPNSIYILRNAFTLEHYRRKGYSEKLYNEAKKHIKSFVFSGNLSDEGKLFKQGVEKKYCNGGDVIKGGLSEGKSITDIAKMHGVSVERVEKEIIKGMDIEKEHSPDTRIQREIAKDHLVESIYYYDDLKKMENERERKNK